MNRICARLEQLSQKSQKAFIPFIVAGDPDLDKTEQLVLELEQAGADCIELGVPFSDPIADGIVIQEAAQRALAQGVSLRDVVSFVKKVRTKTQVPLLLFTYFNPVLAYGMDTLARDAARAGVDGILCVDLPPEEAGDYKKYMDEHNIVTVFLVAPTSPDERIALIAKQSTGFIYYVSRTGVTGVRNQVEQSVPAMVQKIKAFSNKPVCVGFGVSTPEQAKQVAGYADGVIVGSAIVKIIGDYQNSPDLIKVVGDLARSLARAIKNP